MPLIPQGTGASISKSPPPSLPPLTPQDRAKFTRIFQGCGPVNGLLNGMSAHLHVVGVNCPPPLKATKHVMYSSNPNSLWINYLKYGA